MRHLTCSEAGEALSVSYVSVLRAIQRGQINCIKLPRGKLTTHLIPLSEIERILKIPTDSMGRRKFDRTYYKIYKPTGIVPPKLNLQTPE